ncbi:MAG: helix-turn-helix domain-containing protein [Jatrophihabitans sp.]
MSVSDHVSAAELVGERVTRVRVSARGARGLGRVVQSASPGAVELRRGTVHAPVPGEILEMLRTLAAAVDDGSDITVFMVRDGAEGASVELTSQQTADVLNVSRPHVVKLAKQGVLPHRMVGNRHRFLAADIQDFRRREAARRSEVLAGLAPEGGYTPDDF